MLTETPTPTPTPTPNRRWLLLAVAAVVVLVVAGIALANNRDDDQPPSPTAAATVASPTTVAPAMETVRFVVINTDVPVTFAAPVDWIVDEGWAAHTGVGIDKVGLQFDVIPNIYADGCQWEPLDPPVGPTVDDLAEAWANLPQYSATAADDVTVDGYAGKQVEFTVPDFNVAECRGADSPVFGLWTAPDHAFPGLYASPNQHIEQRILDVDGTRLVISAYYLPSGSPQDRAALDEVLDSIQIG